VTFKVGDMVEWESQAGSYWKRKRGQVWEIVPPVARPNVRGVGFGRDHESYVVWVPGTGKYWPRVSHLKPVEGGQDGE
jgi:hypothetical protein